MRLDIASGKAEPWGKGRAAFQFVRSNVAQPLPEIVSRNGIETPGALNPGEAEREKDDNRASGASTGHDSLLGSYYIAACHDARLQVRFSDLSFRCPPCLFACFPSRFPVVPLHNKER